MGKYFLKIVTTFLFFFSNSFLMIFREENEEFFPIISVLNGALFPVILLGTESYSWANQRNF